MLSVHISHPLTVAVARSAWSAVKVASTDAAPPMSIFMSRCIGSDGLRLMPPESYMMPLPTRPRWPLDAPFGVYRSFTMRGSSALPALTPSRPPQPRSMSCCRSNTSTSNPNRRPSATATSAEVGGGEVAGRGVREVAGDVRGASGDDAGLDAGGCRTVVDAVDEQLDALEGRVLRLPLQLAEPVAGEDGALGQRLGRVRGIRRADRRHAQADAAEPGGRPGECGGRVAQARGAELGGRAAPTTTISGRAPRQVSVVPGFASNPANASASRSRLEAGGQVAVARDDHADGVEALLVELLRRRPWARRRATGSR